MLPDSTIQWRAYPALLLAACLAAGIALATLLPALSFWLWIGAAGLGFVLAVVPRLLARHRLVTPAPLLGTLAIALLVVALGSARILFERGLPTTHVAHRIYQHPDREIMLTGRLLSHPIRRRSGARFVLDAGVLIAGRDTLETMGRVQVTLARSPWPSNVSFPALAQGDVVRLRGRLRPVPRRRNPADFDYGRYLKQRDIYAILTVPDPASIAVEGHLLRGVEWVVVPARAYVLRQLNRLIPSEDARAVLRALVLGDRGSLEDATRERFSRTGLAHLLAVSGLHVLLVGMILYGVLRPTLMRLGIGWLTMEISRSLATVVLLSAYVLVAGASASAMRALVMAILFIGGGVLQRSAHPLNTLGVAAVVLLLVRPVHLFEPGFQLSFTAVAAIVTLHPLLHEGLPEAWTARPLSRHVLTMITVSLAATLGTTPVLLYHFGQASFAGLMLNLLAVPLTTLVLAAGLVALLLGGGFPFGAAAFGAAADVLAHGLLWTAKLGEVTLGWAAIRSYVQDPWSLLTMTALLVMLAQWPRPRLRWRLGATALCLATIGAWTGPLNGTTSSLDVVFFDVGHGDAALVTLPGGQHLLIDAGNRDVFSDTGTRTILPHLERFGIRRIDAIVITHPHSDHLGGLPALLRAVPVGRVLHNGQPHTSSLYAETIHLLDSLAVPHQAVHAGDTLALDPAVLIQILAPEQNGGTGETNDASVVLRLIHDEVRLLFTGDAEAEAERRMVARYGPLLRSDVIKAGHHGSRTSSTEALVRRTVPDTTRAIIVLVSVGTRARFDLPAEEVLVRWQARGATVWITAQRGALWLRSDGKRVQHVAWR